MGERCCEHNKCPGGSLCCCPPPSFREIARAEAERRWPDTGISPTTAPLALAWHDTGMASGFVLGALWATEVTDEMVERAYTGWREAQRGGPLQEGEFEATFSRVEFAWLRAALEAALSTGRGE